MDIAVHVQLLGKLDFQGINVSKYNQTYCRRDNSNIKGLSDWGRKNIRFIGVTDKV